jgi:hypothetical protein
MKNAVFWDVAKCGSCQNRRFTGKVVRSVLQLLLSANVVPSSLILSTLTMDTIRSSETSVLTKATWRHDPQYGILYIAVTDCTL